MNELETLNTIIEQNQMISKTLVCLLILLSFWLIGKVVNRALNRWQKSTLKKIKQRNQGTITAVETRISMTKRIIQILIYSFAFIMVFLQFEALKSIGTALLASAGIAGIVIGMASQTTLSNIIAGISISFAQPVRLKDAVIYNNDFGWIEEIALMHTIIKTWDNRRIIVPNNVLVNSVIQNWTIKDATLLGSVFVFADYTCDVDQVRQWVKDIVNESKHTTKEKVAITHVVECTDKAMQLRILALGPDAPTTWELRCEIREKLMKKFKEAGVPMPTIRVDKEDVESLAAAVNKP